MTTELPEGEYGDYDPEDGIPGSRFNGEINVSHVGVLHGPCGHEDCPYFNVKCSYNPKTERTLLPCWEHGRSATICWNCCEGEYCDNSPHCREMAR
jgi:hypothetical protein